MPDDTPQGFLLSEAAMYAYSCQDVYVNILEFAVAIPDHLKPLFLIPISIAPAPLNESSDKISSVTEKLANSLESDLFGVETFVADDYEPTTTDTEEGSIFDIDGYWEKTKQWDKQRDENIQDPSDTSYMSDIDITQYQRYPYRTIEKPVRHSSDRVIFARLALKPESLLPKTPEKIKTNAEACDVRLISYDKRGRIFTFGVNCGKGERNVRASLTEIDEIVLSCTCPFWKWNGPEFHAKSNKFLLGPPRGTATPPDVRDPDRVYWICKHAYAVIKRLDSFLQDVIEANWDAEDEKIMEIVDENWDKLENPSRISLSDLRSEEPKETSEEDEKEEAEKEEEKSKEQEPEPEPEAEEPKEEEEV